MEATQFLYKRQQFLISLIRNIKKKATDTDLQKIIFSYCKNKGLNYYQFIPYKFGAFSPQLSRDYEFLKSNGYFETTGNLAMQETIDLLAIEELRGDDLIRKTYKLHPYYAINSEIAERILDEYSLKNIDLEKQKLMNNEKVLFSIGYEGKSIEEFVNILIKNSIKTLCDIRYNPLSRKFGFRQQSLQKIVESVGISYVHIQGLGIKSDQRQMLETKDDYIRLFVNYEKTLAKRQHYINEVLSLVNSKNRVAIMCYEADPICCHRNVIKNYLINNFDLKCEDL